MKIYNGTSRALKGLKDILRASLDAVPDGVLIVDNNQCIFYFNQRLIELFQLHEHILKNGKDKLSLKAILEKVRNPQKFLEKIESLMQDKEARVRDEIELKDGRVLERYSSPLYDKNDSYKGRICFFRDITNRKIAEINKFEIELHNKQLEKLESLRNMSAAIAHNFNNLLTVILGNIELAQRNKSKDPSIYLSRSKDAALEAAQIARQLLLYLGNEPVELRVLNLEMELKRIVKEIEKDLTSNVEICLDCEEPILIKSSPSLLREAFLNLFKNSIEAIGKRKGYIKISIKNNLLLEEGGFCPTGKPSNLKRFCCVNIVDNGEGIDPDELSKIFDPFFTSKMIGRGLGLSIVQGIMTIHEGTVCISSTPKKGTTVKLYFPVVGD